MRQLLLSIACFLLVLVMSLSSCSSSGDTIKGKICNSFGACGEIDTDKLFIKDGVGKKYNLKRLDVRKFLIDNNSQDTLEIINDNEMIWSGMGRLKLMK
jgi:hypothetical protein